MLYYIYNKYEQITNINMFLIIIYINKNLYKFCEDRDQDQSENLAFTYYESQLLNEVGGAHWFLKFCLLLAKESTEPRILSLWLIFQELLTKMKMVHYNDTMLQCMSKQMFVQTKTKICSCLPAITPEAYMWSGMQSRSLLNQQTYSN